MGLAPLGAMNPAIRHPAHTPSGTKSGTVTGAALFGIGGEGAASFGTAVHAALAMVEWSTGADDFLSLWRAAGWGEAVVSEAWACLEAPALTEVFANRPGAEVWRERAFEVVMDGVWITGIFDRVVLVRDRNRRVISAAVYDFKTDRTGPDELDRLGGRYAQQMEIYRRVLARLTGILESEVQCALVLTGLRRMRPV